MNSQVLIYLLLAVFTILPVLFHLMLTQTHTHIHGISEADENSNDLEIRKKVAILIIKFAIWFLEKTNQIDEPLTDLIV